MALSSKQLDSVMNDMAFWLRRWHDNPLAFIVECLGEMPTHQQAVILKAIPVHGFVAARSGHGIGKTRLMAWIVWWWLCTRKMPGAACRIPCTGPSEAGLKRTLWSEITEVGKLLPAFFDRRFDITVDKVTCTEDSKGWFATICVARPENPDALQGFHNCFFLIDEGSGVPDQVFEVARGAMGDEGSMGCMFGNPTRTAGYFYRAFNGSKFWHCLHFRSTDSLAHKTYEWSYVDALGEIVTFQCKGRQTQEWVDDMADEFGINSNTYRIRVLGEFAELDTTDSIIEPVWLENVFTTPARSATKKRAKVMAIDPARSGEDSTAVVIRQGLEILYAEEWHGFDLYYSRKRCELIQSEWGCDRIYIDANGLGAGLYDEMKARTFPVYAVDVNESSPEDRECFKMRDYLWWRARKFFRQNTVRFALDYYPETMKKLARELPIITYKLNNKGKVLAESKDDMKKRGHKSPNLSDAFNMTLQHDADIHEIRGMTKKGMDTVRNYLRQQRGARAWATA